MEAFVRRKRIVLGAAVAAAVAAANVAFAANAGAASVGPDTTYLVLAKGNNTAKAAERIAGAGGRVVATYDQIGVLVARSTNPAFADAVAGGTVEAAASTSGWGPTLAGDG